MAQLFYRNVRARDQLDIFLVSAISSLLLLRFYLSAAGYPQVGNGSLHIAHMLWGGLLMLVAIVISLSFLGARIQRFTALIGGVGFGIFIDELGKFITKDNNYFFRPTIGIIYAIFIVLYLASNFVGRRQKLTSREYQLNALAQLEEAVVRDMDEHEKARVAELLARADQNDPLTKHLEEFLDSVQVVQGHQPHVVKRFLGKIDRAYRAFWRRRSSTRLIRAFFLIETGLFLLGIFLSIYNNIDNVIDIFSGHTTYSHFLVFGQLASSLVAAGFALAGVSVLRKSRMSAFEQFRRASLITIYLTEFFVFSREQFAALPGFIFTLALLLFINFVLHQERYRTADSLPQNVGGATLAS